MESHRFNNFDFIRFVAASAVLVSHAWPIAGLRYEPFGVLTGGLESAGGLAVSIFFLVSGFLVTGSLLKSKSLLVYASSRFLRVIPGMVFLAAFTILVIGPLNTALNLKDYFAHPDTIGYAWIISIFSPAVSLPGALATTPIPLHVNGSLWTLPIEVFMYAALALCGLLRLLTVRRMAVVVALLLLARLNMTAHLGYNWGNQGPILYFETLHLYSIVRLGYWFAIGSFLYLARTHIPVRWDIAVLCAVAFVASWRTQAAETMYFLTVPYLVYYVAFARLPALSVFSRFGDYSYGIYIFAFPIQQTVINLFPKISMPVYLLSTFALTLLMAVISWHLVEAPALSLKRKIAAMRARQPSVALATGQ